jgi:hypothetical protein
MRIHHLDRICAPGLRACRRMMEKDRRARLGNQRRLRALRQARAADVGIFCGHDDQAFERLAGRSIHRPAGDRGA